MEPAPRLPASSSRVVPTDVTRRLPSSGSTRIRLLALAAIPDLRSLLNQWRRMARLGGIAHRSKRRRRLGDRPAAAPDEKKLVDVRDINEPGPICETLLQKKAERQDDVIVPAHRL